MILNAYVAEYINQYKNSEINLNKERALLIAHLEKHILSRSDLHFDNEQIENFVKFTEKWYFPLEPFQKFIAAFVFLYYEDGANFYEQFFIMMGRGGGKNGLISALSHFFISPLHGISKYNISIVANTEKQAKTSFKEIYDCIDEHDSLQNQFDHKKAEIVGLHTKSVIEYHTSNAKTKDSLRDGCVIYDEIHEYESAEIVDVFSSGLGKVRNSREFFISTDGYVREGYLDKMKERAMNVLRGEDLDDPIFPFLCKLDDKKEMDNQECWEKANPMFSKPMSSYAKGLYRKLITQHKQLSNNPTSREVFITKRMNLPEVDPNKTVAPWEEIEATNRPIPDLSHKLCVGGLDYGEIKDFAAVGLLFKNGEDYIWKTHSFVRQGFLDRVKMKAPIKKWEEDGLLTIVDGPVISISHIVDWFVKMREHYGLSKIVADTFRLDLVKTALEAEGFELIYIRNPKAAHAKLAPRVETMFAQKHLVFGDNELMRWYTNNVYVHIKKDGNKEYLKKDEFRRKTDGFQALIHALWEADNVLDEEVDFFLEDIAF
ncbi:terminase TerL endonuclease subunit [Halobacillus litoralis]|uniref:terminase TerL endonuclease subunit n=1 Tax=Halobacillus litoralis TaxID=45668 RepID=UPI001CD6D0D1|nr:terminase TerL endonuclease subunit [Halobacillus litoralis]MCA1021802.1 terminase large subunit [Halobacillus litoralis]